MGISKYKESYVGAYYHIYNRGNNKQQIFLGTEDYAFYIKRLRIYLDKSDLSLVCYVLMPNHLHLVIRQNSEKVVSRFIPSLHTSYSMYFNKKYNRVGHLFQGRFKQKIIKEIEGLAWLSCYIHLNPEHDNIVKNTKEYCYSSYLDYIGVRNGTLCDRSTIENYFECQGGRFYNIYKKFVEQHKSEIKERKELKKLIENLN